MSESENGHRGAPKRQPTINMFPALHDRLRKFADARGLAMNAVVSLALEQYLDDKEQEGVHVHLHFDEDILREISGAIALDLRRALCDEGVLIDEWGGE